MDYEVCNMYFSQIFGFIRNRPDAPLADGQIHLYGITAFTGSLPVSIRMRDSLPPVIARGHLQVMQRMTLPEIEFHCFHSSSKKNLKNEFKTQNRVTDKCP